MSPRAESPEIADRRTPLVTYSDHPGLPDECGSGTAGREDAVAITVVRVYDAPTGGAGRAPAGASRCPAQ